jgi:hypothetical protein
MRARCCRLKVEISCPLIPSQALHDNEWIMKLSTEVIISIKHLIQFVQLWVLTQDVQLNDEVEDNITWKLTSNGEYSAVSAYKLQFFWPY